MHQKDSSARSNNERQSQTDRIVSYCVIYCFGELWQVPPPLFVFPAIKQRGKPHLYYSRDVSYSDKVKVNGKQPEEQVRLIKWHGG